MATTKNESTTQETDSGSLSDFTFDNPTEFFGIKNPTSQTGNVIKEVKQGAIIKDEKVVDEIDSDEVTSLEDKPDKGKSKTSGKAGGKTDANEEQAGKTTKFFGQTFEDDEIDDDDDLDKDDDDEEETKAPKKEVKKDTKVKKEAEAIEDEDEDEDEDEEDTKRKVKKDDVAVSGKRTAETATDESDDDEETKTADKDKEFYTTLANEMTEKGIFQNIKLEKDKKIDVDEFFELQNNEIEARVDEAIEAFAEDMDDDAKAFIKFKKSGGNTLDFFSGYANDLDIKELDENDEAQRGKVILHYLTTVKKLDLEEASETLATWKESGKDKIRATKYFNEIKEEEKARKEEMIVAEETAKTNKEKAARKFSAEMLALANETDSYGSFTLTKDERRKLVDSITKPTVKVGKANYIPSTIDKLIKITKGATPEDKKRMLILSKLVEADFKVAGLEEGSATKATKKIKSKLKEIKEGAVKTANTGSSNKGKFLSDFFSGDE